MTVIHGLSGMRYLPRKIGPAIPVKAVPPKQVCVLGHDSFELLHYDVTGDSISVSLLADRKALQALDGDPLEVQLLLGDGSRIRGASLQLEESKWVTGRIVSLTLHGQPNSIICIAPPTHTPDFI